MASLAAQEGVPGGKLEARGEKLAENCPVGKLCTITHFTYEMPGRN